MPTESHELLDVLHRDDEVPPVLCHNAVGIIHSEKKCAPYGIYLVVFVGFIMIQEQTPYYKQQQIVWLSLLQLGITLHRLR